MPLIDVSSVLMLVRIQETKKKMAIRLYTDGK